MDRNIEREIICDYKKVCKHYRIWHGSSGISKCVKCKNNKYKNPKEEKESYYSSPNSEKILESIIVTVFIVYVVLAVVL